MTHDPRLPWRFVAEGVPVVQYELILDCANVAVTENCKYSESAPSVDDMQFIVHAVNAHRQLIDAAKLLLNVYEGRRCGSLRQSVDEQNLRKLIAECNHE